MRLVLKNFRCYEDKTFNFDMESGMLLLSGPSGSGKTTILSAINFVLYDKGTKLITLGKTSLSVQFEIGDWNIVRTKRPNRVVLNIADKEYQDDSAQHIINERFGTSFDVVSYVQQNNLKSFIAMSPTDKLDFLEKFAFEGVNLPKLKARCKELVKKHNEDLISVTSKLEQSSEYFKSLNSPEKVQFPLKQTKNREKSIKNEQIRYKNSLVLIKRTETQLSQLDDNINNLKIYLAKKESLDLSLEHLTTKLEILKKELSQIDYRGDENLETLEDTLKKVITYRELQYLVNNYEEDKKRLSYMKEVETNSKREKLEELEGKIWQDYSREEVEELIEDYSHIISDVLEIERLEKNLENYTVDSRLEEYKETLEKYKKDKACKHELLEKLKLQKKIYQCPNCEISLHFSDERLSVYCDELLEYDEDIEELSDYLNSITLKIENYERKIHEWENNLKQSKKYLCSIDRIRDKYEDDLPDYKKAKENIDYIKKYKDSQTQLEMIISGIKKELEEEIYSSAVITFSHTLSKQKNRIKFLKESINSDIKLEDEQTLRREIELQKKDKNTKESIDKQILTIRREITEIKNEMETKYTDLNLQEMEEQKIKLGKELETYKNNSSVHSANLAKIQEYERYVKELELYNEWKHKVEKLQEDEQSLRKQYAGATLLKDKILEAESLAIGNLVDSINVHAQDYLDKFFPIDPISVRLQSFKHTKKSSKPQINLSIEYKGMEMDISMLSGGEVARVVLAFALALAEMFNSPLIMLDECTANIDQNLTNVVVDGIRENFSEKIVIVIAHQVVSGIFDKVWEME